MLSTTEIFFIPKPLEWNWFDLSFFTSTVKHGMHPSFANSLKQCFIVNFAYPRFLYSFSVYKAEIIPVPVLFTHETHFRPFSTNTPPDGFRARHLAISTSEPCNLYFQVLRMKSRSFLLEGSNRLTWTLSGGLK